MSTPEETEALKTLVWNQHAFLITKIMFTASDLGVFDLLMESKEPLTSVVIAQRLGASPFGMESLLDACVGYKFLQMERKDNQTFYGNTNHANLYLGRRSPKTHYYSLKFCAEYLYTKAQHMADSVREGEAQTTDEYYEDMYRTEDDMRGFMEFMREMWSMCGRDALTAFDLSRFPLVCDVGGCSGALAKECISLYPDSTVTILDLPEVVEIGKKYFVSAEEHRITFQEGSVAGVDLPEEMEIGMKHFVSSEEHRITFQEGDFFKDPIPEADLYILTRILHCFTDEKCVALLTRLHKACKAGGGVLVLEIGFNEDRMGPWEAQVYAMAVFLVTQGKVRTPSEYRALFTAAGFKEIQQKKTNHYDAILARK